MPLVWKVIEHKSSTVSYDVYKGALDGAVMLLPERVEIILLADRGFADTELMRHSRKLGWYFRCRGEAFS